MYRMWILSRKLTISYSRINIVISVSYSVGHLVYDSIIDCI